LWNIDVPVVSELLLVVLVLGDGVCVVGVLPLEELSLEEVDVGDPGGTGETESSLALIFGFLLGREAEGVEVEVDST
jgi:hypothetical protein